MNIFVLDNDPYYAAQYHADVHVNKMILESAQLLSTAMTFRGANGPYKPTHSNHPCAVWARQSVANFQWLVDLFSCLCYEYGHRKNKEHSCYQYLSTFRYYSWAELRDDAGLTPFPMAMPDCFKLGDDVVASYRNYYNHKHLMFKRNKMTWTNREQPFWYDPAIDLPDQFFSKEN